MYLYLLVRTFFEGDHKCFRSACLDHNSRLLRVFGVIVVNSQGTPIVTTFNNTQIAQYAGLLSSLADEARSVVKEMDLSDDLTFLRIK